MMVDLIQNLFENFPVPISKNQIFEKYSEEPSSISQALVTLSFSGIISIEKGSVHLDFLIYKKIKYQETP